MPNLHLPFLVHNDKCNSDDDDDDNNNNNNNNNNNSIDFAAVQIQFNGIPH